MAHSQRVGFGAVVALCCLAAGLFVPQDVSAQRRSNNQWSGPRNSLHSKPFNRSESGIYQGRREGSHGHYGHGNHGHHHRYGSPYVYTPYVAAPYVYDPSFVSPGYYGGYVDPYSPYNVPVVGYGNRFFGVEVYGPSPLVTVPPIAAPVPIAPPVTPVEHHVANSKEEARQLREMMRNGDPERLPVPPTPQVFRKSTPEQQLASVRKEQAGDRDFRAGRFLLAYTHYKDAIDEAEDRTEPRLKLVAALATVGQYARAAGALRSLLELDPEYGHHFLSLDAVFGDKQLTKESMKTRVARWALEHVENPERLLLLGAVSYFDGEIPRARQLLENVALYEDLAPLVQSFLVEPGGAPLGEPAQSASPLNDGPFDIPFADIPADIIPGTGVDPKADGGDTAPIAPPLPVE